MNNFSKCVIVWFQKNARMLPFRGVKDPYKIWISEIMLQQTTVKAVIPFYKAWIKKFPTVKDVSSASSRSVLKAWQGLGYYQRVHNIHKSAKIIVKKHNGRVPDNYEELRSLPGFGPYTTGAVLSIAYHKPYTIIDANIKRVFIRQFALKNNDRIEEKISSYLENILPKKGISEFNQGLMEIGALICKSKNPLCIQCPIRKFCKAYKAGIQEIIPKPKKLKIKEIQCVIAVLKRNNKYYIQRRDSKGLFANLWEFPGGKMEEAESAGKAVRREVLEELGVHVTSSKFLTKVTQYYTQFKAILHVFHCELDKYPNSCRSAKWLKLKELEKYPMPSGSAKIYDYLQAK